MKLFARLIGAALLGWCCTPGNPQAAAQTYTHFEARQTHSVALTPDGNRLMALNSPDARLSVFDVSNPGTSPVLLAEIPVGLEPVAVRARTNDEIWVVNEVGDSISIVSLSRGAVVATLPAADEPADVVFAQGKAFVTCARSNLVRVFDAATRQELSSILLDGLEPRALAVDPSGTKIYAAFLMSGNGTTILPRNQAPAQPSPTNPALPAPPKTSLIVPATDARINYTVLDRDVVEIDAASGAVTRYFGQAGTNLLDLTVHPVSGEIWVANTDARNLVRFEPVLNGHIADHRLSRLAQQTGAVTVHDLNPGIDYSVLPNPAAQATALAQPTAIAFSADGSHMWVAAFGSDRVARITTDTGAVSTRVDVRTDGGGAEVMRGPRALALHPVHPRLFVLNKLAGTISVIATDLGFVTDEVPIATHDFMPAAIRKGRGFLFDARLSGNGTASCATCHIDADRDGLAWDLGDPTGDMLTVMGANLSAHDTKPRPRVMHPMKGPMVTQTLRGMQKGAPFHWRGDRPTLQSFNPTFANLMGGSQISSADMDALAAYLLSLRNHPNPFRSRDGSLPAVLSGGNPTRGQTLFNRHDNHCAVCHDPVSPNNNIDLPQEVGAIQPIKNPTLATTYQRMLFNPRAGQQSLSGFGLNHDGTGFALPTVHPYVLDQLSSAADFADVTAFVLCFDSGTAPAVGDSVTVDASNASGALSAIARLESQNQAAVSDLVVEGMIGGVRRSFIFSRALQLYVPSVFGEEPLTRTALLASLGPDDSLTFLGVPPNEGARFSGDVNRNALLGSDSYFVKNKKKTLTIPVEKGVLANDTRVAAPADAASVEADATLGTTLLNADGSFTYTPRKEFGASEIDSFSYRVRIAGDSGNATEPSAVTISTIASAAGRYTGPVKEDGNPKAAGFVNISISRGGTWTASAYVGTKRYTLKGKVEVDGELRPSRAPKIDLSLRLFAEPNGRRGVRANLREGSDHFVGLMQRSPYSSKSPAPNPGKHTLTFTMESSSGTPPVDPPRATLKISKNGLASLKGKLGDGTKFSFAGPVTERAGGGWELPVYTVLYKHPPGSMTGDLQFTAEPSAGITGTLNVIKPEQTRPRKNTAGFTIDYAVTSSPQP